MRPPQQHEEDRRDDRFRVRGRDELLTRALFYTRDGEKGQHAVRGHYVTHTAGNQDWDRVGVDGVGAPRDAAEELGAVEGDGGRADGACLDELPHGDDGGCVHDDGADRREVGQDSVDDSEQSHFYIFFPSFLEGYMDRGTEFKYIFF